MQKQEEELQKLMLLRDFVSMKNKHGGWCFLVSHHYKTPKGHAILDAFCYEIIYHNKMERQENKIPFVVFYYVGIFRKKRSSKTYDHQFFKRAICDVTAQEAVTFFEKWHDKCKKEIEQWKIIL